MAQETVAQKAMLQGRVKWFDPDKSYGFITVKLGKDRKKDYFCHLSYVRGDTTPQKNQRVRFRAAPSRKGLEARDVELL